jgi:hypothetical protein
LSSVSANEERQRVSQKQVRFRWICCLLQALLCREVTPQRKKEKVRHCYG